MIRRLTGTVIETIPETVIMTGSGVGYLVTCPKRTALLPHDTVTLYTHHALRETADDLYGFVTPHDLEIFELLLTISGIGPKSAMDILDKADRTLILTAVSNNDADQLVTLAGLGRKTAEKIILGLKDKIDTAIIATPITGIKNAQYQDAFDTLLALGYNPQSVRQVLDTMDQNASTTTLVKAALQQL